MAAADRLALASDLWMAAHDRPTGDSLLSPKPLGIGLGAALLCELIFANWVTKVEDNIFFLHEDAEHHPLPSDVALSEILMQLLREANAQRLRSTGRHQIFATVGLSVDDWIQHLQAGDAQRLVERRLDGAKLVTQEQHRSLFRAPRVVYVPALTSTAGWPAARIKTALNYGRELDESDIALAGLLIASGLQNDSLGGLSRDGYTYLARQTQAKLRYALRVVIARAETAVGRLAMTR